ncbi:MAG: sigma-70 family RNA polymerase sigma factor [Bacilli bacterium]|nr:sigma-70 family RNA polymerase sigma factor [Bacilli bacterium]
MELLLKKTINRDKESLEKLIKGIEKRLYVIAMARLMNEADAKDAIQETLIKVYSKINQLRSMENVISWATKILINECNNILKKRKKVEISYDDLEMEKYLKDDEYIDIENNYNFFELIEHLSIEERTILSMYYSEDYTTKEISKILRVNENTIRTKIKRAKLKIKKKFEEEN